MDFLSEESEQWSVSLIGVWSQILMAKWPACLGSKYATPGCLSWVGLQIKYTQEKSTSGLFTIWIHWQVPNLHQKAAGVFYVAKWVIKEACHFAFSICNALKIYFTFNCDSFEPKSIKTVGTYFLWHQMEHVISAMVTLIRVTWSSSYMLFPFSLKLNGFRLDDVNNLCWLFFLFIFSLINSTTDGIYGRPLRSKLGAWPGPHRGRSNVSEVVFESMTVGSIVF